MQSELHRHVARMAAVMAGYPAPWALCGGWAVDWWLGRQTRDHGDIDITVFSSDQPALFAHLRDWNLVPHDAVAPAGSDPWDGHVLVLPAHIHARPPGAENRARVVSWVTPPYVNARDGLDLELVINEGRDDAWVLSEDPALSLPFARAIARTPGGVPIARPEVLLYYKATAHWGEAGDPRPRDTADFAALSPLLDPDAAAWLRAAIAAHAPDHPWLAPAP